MISACPEFPDGRTTYSPQKTHLTGGADGAGIAEQLNVMLIEEGHRASAIAKTYLPWATSIPSFVGFRERAFEHDLPLSFAQSQLAKRHQLRMKV